MRIDLYNAAAAQADNLVDSKQVKAQGVSTSDASGEGDHATLTSGAGSIASLVSAAMSSPEIRSDKVDSLRHAVSNGQYD